MVMEEKSLIELLNAVNDEESFLAFASALAQERSEVEEYEVAHSSDPYLHLQTIRDWQNSTIASFLDGANAWALAMRFGREDPLGKKGQFQENPWKMFANYLFAGKVYE